MTSNDDKRSPAIVKLLLPIEDVVIMTSHSKRTIERRLKEGRFPKPTMSGRLRLWRLVDIQAWVDAGCPEPGSDGNLSACA